MSGRSRSFFHDLGSLSKFVALPCSSFIVKTTDALYEVNFTSLKKAKLLQNSSFFFFYSILLLQETRQAELSNSNRVQSRLSGKNA